MRLRRYRDEDREAVWHLHNLALEHAGAHGGSGPWDDDLNAIAETYLERGGEFLVGLEGRQIVAMGALRRCDADCAELKRMRVHPAVQRRGLGRHLLHRLEERALELGYRRLVLDTTVRQQAAQALYRKEGYQETGRRRAGAFELIFFEKQVR
ncbi:MAG: GNAT family N-acetyltransferase [Actinomycetota bacterium]|nr:GNAT family N-acetyltransferase [Actinomycetota bacterium]